jgi:hypothetical protein
VIIDLTPIRDGTGPARLLDMVEGRSKQVFKTWLGERHVLAPGVEVVAMDELDRRRRGGSYGLRSYCRHHHRHHRRHHRRHHHHHRRLRPRPRRTAATSSPLWSRQRSRPFSNVGDQWIGARRWSGTVRRLRLAEAVQVAPCGVLGLCYGPPLDAAAQLLPAEEASRAAAELARKYRVRRRSLTSWLHRARRPRMVHYELLADDATDDQDTYLQDLPAPGQRGDQSGSYAAGSHGSGQCQILRTHVTDHGAGSIACIWPAPAHVRPRQP